MMDKNTFSTFDPVGHAALHPIVRTTPAVDFFEGAVLGNGGLGAIVCVRPDAIVVHFGHNNVWDIRIAEDHKEKIGTFQQVFERVKAVPSTYRDLNEDAWCAQYFNEMSGSYRKSYPRPFPCGSFLLGFDRRSVEALGYSLDISTGRCDVRLLVGGRPVMLQVFVEMEADRLWLRTVNEGGKPAQSPFDRVRMIPDPSTPPDLPAFTVPDPMPGAMLSFRQVLPFQEPHAHDKHGHPKDRAFRLTVSLNGPLESRMRTATWTGIPETAGILERSIGPAAEFVACVQLDEGQASGISTHVGNLPDPRQSAFEEASNASRETWREYWNRSGVALEDHLLERTWYWNFYFLNCSVREGITCPGLFANWSYRDIGTAWHGDYHMNYNAQQPFWATFSGNHPDKHLPYVDMVERVLPLERKWAREYYGLRGAYGMHSFFPVEMTTNPYPVPTWGWEICETPWTVQSLWWHYLYTQDRSFLERRAFEPIRDAVLFLVDYMQRPEAHGPQWNDDKYHVFPTVDPELYGLRPGFKNNFDCLVDLTLTKFVFKAFLKACEILGREKTEAALIRDVQEVLDYFPDYPTAESGCGVVFVSVPGENPDIVYNTPNSLMTVFPGEDHGLHSPREEFEIAVNSYRNHRNEGGNELVFLNLQGARLGLLDLERFKRQIEYCLIPNGTCTDKVLQVHGRYDDTTPFDFYSRTGMGIWFENFALPVVINECLFQSYSGTLRFFPNWPRNKRAEFQSLRAVGSFLVSALFERGETQWIEIISEAGYPLRAILPWTGFVIQSSVHGEKQFKDPLLKIETVRGEILQIRNSVP
ncbi:MAG: hypothetical protein V2A65_11345 [Candidatus Omnitrophota bacterium]